MKLAALSLLSTVLLLSLAPRVSADDEAAWRAQVPPGLQKQAAFAYVQEDPKLPRVLLIGDSISIGYTPRVREVLKGEANVLRIPMNGSSTNEGVQKLDAWLGEKKWDVIHFNWGLHDLKYMKDNKLDLAGEQVSSLEKYESNLRQIVQRLKKTGAKLIWASTTPVPEGSAGRAAGDEQKYNAVAAKVMKEEGIPTDDLATAVTPKLAEVQKPKNVHFWPAGDQLLGDQAAASIRQALGK